MGTEPELGPREPKRPSWHQIMGDPDARSSAVEPPPPDQFSRAWWKKHWRRIAAAALLPFAAVGGLAGPPPGGPVTWSAPTTSTLVPTQPAESDSLTGTLLFTPESASGAHYNFSPAWAAHAETAGHEATVQLASSLVDAANKHAGGQWLPPEIRRSLIQFVLLGIGGLDPADATDILQFAADNADNPQIVPPGLEALIRETERQVLGLPSGDGPG
jgi:hypothetical protein